ncbi:hypothetical protein EUTSA_v100028560mg, partial [Eutrema salsugineum]
SLGAVFLNDCSLFKSFPEISTNISYLDLTGTAIEEVPLSISSWSRLETLYMSYSENLKKFPHALDSITELHLNDTKIQEVFPWIKRISHLRRLVLKGCNELLSLPELPDSLSELDAENCESLERLDCSFPNPKIILNFRNCFKLNREIVKLNESPFPSSITFKACFLLANKNDVEPGDADMVFVDCYIMDKQSNLDVSCSPKHMYIFEFEADVTSSELLFEFGIRMGNKRTW